MIAAIYLIACLAFYTTFKKLQIVSRTLALADLFRSAAGVMTDRSLSDLEKEKRIQQTALRSLSKLFWLCLRLVAVLGSAAAPVFVTVLFTT